MENGRFCWPLFINSIVTTLLNYFVWDLTNSYRGIGLSYYSLFAFVFALISL
jgi:hypothetical protein